LRLRALPAAHRDILAAARLGPRFAAQLYSDERRLRKPNPELARRAAAAVGVQIEECWFVGDTITETSCAPAAPAPAPLS